MYKVGDDRSPSSIPVLVVVRVPLGQAQAVRPHYGLHWGKYTTCRPEAGFNWGNEPARATDNFKLVRT